MFLVGSLGATINADRKPFDRTLDSVARDAGRRMTDIGKTMSAAVTAPLAGLATLAVRAFGVQEKAEMQLRAALQANGREVDSLFNRYNEFAQEMQRLTVVGDETTLALLAQAESMGATGDSAERAIRNSIAMQSAFGINAERAMRYTVALEQGEATMLRRYIPALRGVEDQSEMAAKAQEILGNAFSSAEAEAQGASGQMAQMRNAVGDLMEVVGEVIAEAILPFVNRIKEMAETVQTADRSVIAMGVTIGALAAAIGPVLIVLGTFTKALALVLSPIFAKIAALGALVGAFVYVIKNLAAMRDFFVRRFAIIRNTVVLAVAGMVEALNKFISFIPGIESPLQGVQESLIEMIKPLPEIENEFMSFSEFMASVGNNIGDSIKWLSDRVFPDLGSSAKTAVDEMSMSIERAVLPTQELARSFEYVSDTGRGLEGTMDRIASKMNAQAQVAEFATGIANSFTTSFGHGMANVVVQGERLVDVLKNIGKLLASAVIQQGLTALLTGGLGGTGFFGSGGGLLGRVFGGFRSNGGMVNPGSSYVVGENGREIFSPTASGVITPISSGSAQIDHKAIGREVSASMIRHMSRLGPREVYAMSQEGRFV